MTLSTKQKVGISVVVIATSFAFGRYSAPVKIKTEIKTVEVQKKVSDQKVTQNKDKHKETTVVQVTKPDGTKETTTKIVEDDKVKKDSDQTTRVVTNKTTDDKKEEQKESSKLNISVLAGLNVNSSKMEYGVHVERGLIGPITVGVFGISDMQSSTTAGCSVGLTF